MLIAALEQAKPGDRIVVAGFRPGCDALLFEVTEAINDLAPRAGVSGSLAHKNARDSYSRYSVFRYQLLTDAGIRSEAPNQTA